MKREGIIQIKEICIQYDLSPEYLFSLREHGLLDLIEESEEWYLEELELSELEKVLRLQRDLDLTVEGIVVVQHLLDRMQTLQQEIRTLKSRLG